FLGIAAMRIILPAFLALTLAACGGEEEPADTDTSAPTGEVAADPDGSGLPEAVEREVSGQWAVASANPLATEAGAEILRQGGTAVDAAITVQTVLSLVEPQSSGLGGGGFMLYYDAQSGVITAYDGREVAPFSADPAMFLKEDGTRKSYREAISSGKAVGVPATVAMLDLAHREHGRLEWGTLFDEPVRLATEGFAVPPRLGKALPRSADLLKQDDTAAELFFSENGNVLAEGDMFTNPYFAETVTTIAENGAGAFYSGEIAQEIVDTVNARAGNGYMTLEDVFEYEPVARQPVCASFKTYEICTMGPPSSALAMLQTLGMLEARGLPDNPGGDLWVAYAEAGRLAYADRAEYLGDPTAMGSPTVDSREVAEALVAGDYLADRAQLIGTFAAEEVSHGDPLEGRLEDRAADLGEDVPGTSHFSIRDSYGNIVSMTGTIEGAFGSHIMAGGMFLNNELTDFSWMPQIDGKDVVNAVGPGKRPRSSMTPSIVLDQDGQPVAAIGSAGGANIIGHVTKTLLLALGYDMPWQEAIDAPHVTTRVGTIYLEDTAPEGYVTALEGYGHNVRVRELNSSLHGFRLDGGKVECGADSRRDGTCLSGN
ncbi:MAG: gamma-glutamyltransferase, partial [Pseudomonadota bacterium]